MAHVFSLSESAVTSILSCLPRVLSAGVICVTLQHPDTFNRDITIVDMPGEFTHLLPTHALSSAHALN